MDEHDENATHLSTTQAAHTAGISRQRMLQLIKDQKVPAIETRHGYRVARDAVEYLKSERRLINDQRALVNVGHDLAEEMQRIADRLEPTVLRAIKTFEETIKRASPLAVAEAVAPFTAAMQDTMRAEVTRAPMRRYAEEMEAIRARMVAESRHALQVAAKLAPTADVQRAAEGIASAMDNRKMGGVAAAMNAAAEHHGVLQATRGFGPIDIVSKFGQLHGPCEALKVFAARPDFLAGLAGQFTFDPASIVGDALKEGTTGMMKRMVASTALPTARIAAAQFTPPAAWGETFGIADVAARAVREGKAEWREGFATPPQTDPARLGERIEMSMPPISERPIPPAPLDKGYVLPISRESPLEEKVDDLRCQVEELKALVLGRQGETTVNPTTEHPDTESGAHWQRGHGTDDPAVVLDRFAAIRAKTRGEAEDATAIIRASRDRGLPRG
ncbi:MAG: hypothetical protein ACR2M3_08320 [Thermomicrobiales bacterium]